MHLGKFYVSLNLCKGMANVYLKFAKDFIFSLPITPTIHYIIIIIIRVETNIQFIWILMKMKMNNEIFGYSFVMFVFKCTFWYSNIHLTFAHAQTKYV